ncbi:MAG: hypothetical protein MUC81_13630 [Bacteroidia bacterium]|jgi:hypothetical protein|nr:hypothetical protein [Bacteroidia bacterium]
MLLRKIILVLIIFTGSYSTYAQTAKQDLLEATHSFYNKSFELKMKSVFYGIYNNQSKVIDRLSINGCSVNGNLMYSDDQNIIWTNKKYTVMVDHQDKTIYIDSIINYQEFNVKQSVLSMFFDSSLFSNFQPLLVNTDSINNYWRLTSLTNDGPISHFDFTFNKPSKVITQVVIIYRTKLNDVFGEVPPGIHKDATMKMEIDYEYLKEINNNEGCINIDEVFSFVNGKIKVQPKYKSYQLLVMFDQEIKK